MEYFMTGNGLFVAIPRHKDELDSHFFQRVKVTLKEVKKTNKKLTPEIICRIQKKFNRRIYAVSYD